MAIVVLEGVNGVGKTSYATALEAIGYAVLRPFRPNSGFHFDGNSRHERELKALGVPVNTCVDDLYVADILGKLGRQPTAYGPQALNVVLDRSMPSAIAYESGPLATPRTMELMQRWKASFSDAKVVYVNLVAPWEVCKFRLDPSRASTLRDTLPIRFGALFEMINWPKLTIDTSLVSVKEGVELILAKAQ
jgi:predicted ATPase